MTIALIDNYLWCALQVTLLALAGALLYLLLRGQTSLRAALPQWFLIMVVFLSLLFVSPWPSWSWFGQSLSDESQSTQIVFLNAPPELEGEQLSSLKNHGFQIHTIPSEEEPPTVESVPLQTAATAIPKRSSVLWKKSLRKSSSLKRGFVLFASVSCLLATARLLFAWRELRKRLLLSVLIEEEQLQEEFSSLYQQYSLPRPVALRESSLDELPATVGWRRPVILLPPSWREWTPEQRRAVLAHELAHIEHHDFATWLVAQLPLLLHSYHPLVHWFARQLRWEQEISADRRAIEVLGDHESYLAALAELALEPAKNRRPSNGYSLAPSSSMLLRRLQMLRSNRTEKARKAPRLKRLLLLASLGAVLLGVSGLRAQAPNNKAVAQPTSDKTSATITAMVMLSPPSSYNDENHAEVFWETQFSLIESPFVLQSTLSQQQVADSNFVKTQKNPLEWIQKQLKVNRIPDSPVLRFQFQCPAGEAATGVKIIDALTKIYKQEIRRQNVLRSSDSDKQIERLAKLHLELKKELQNKMEKYQNLAEELGGAESPISATILKMLINELRVIRSQITQKNEDLVELKINELKINRIVADQHAKNETTLEQAVAVELANDPMIANYEAEEFATLQQIRSLKETPGQEATTTIKRLKESLAQLQKEAVQYRKETETETRKALKYAPGGLLKSMNMEYFLRRDSITAEIKKLEVEYAKKVGKIEQRGVTSSELTMLDSEIEQLKQVASDMSFKLRSWQINSIPAQSAIKAIILMPATVTNSPAPSE